MELADEEPGRRGPPSAAPAEQPARRGPPSAAPVPVPPPPPVPKHAQDVHLPPPPSPHGLYEVSHLPDAPEAREPAPMGFGDDGWVEIGGEGWGFEKTRFRRPDPPANLHPSISCHGYVSVVKQWIFPGEPAAHRPGGEELAADRPDGGEPAARPDGSQAPPELKLGPSSCKAASAAAEVLPKARGSLGAALGLTSCGFRPSLEEDEHQIRRKKQLVTWLCFRAFFLKNIFPRKHLY